MKQERLAQAESRSRTVSVAALDSNASARIDGREVSVKVEPKPEPIVVLDRSLTAGLRSGATGTKRRREEEMAGEGDELLEVAPPPRKPKVVIDLTDG